MKIQVTEPANLEIYKFTDPEIRSLLLFPTRTIFRSFNPSSHGDCISRTLVCFPALRFIKIQDLSEEKRQEESEEESQEESLVSSSTNMSSGQKYASKSSTKFVLEDIENMISPKVIKRKS